MGWLFRTFLFAYMLWWLWSGLRRLLLPAPQRPVQHHKEKADGLLMAKDPQCGRFVVEQEAIRASVRGQRLSFCSTECRDLYKGQRTP